MGVRAYSEAADLWSIGCIVAEMLRGTPLFAGTSQIEQLFLIFAALGTPTEGNWPGVTAAPYFASDSFPEWGERRIALSACVRTATSADLDLVRRCLTCCPDRRASAAQLLQHPAILGVCPVLTRSAQDATTTSGSGTGSGVAVLHASTSLASRLVWAYSFVRPTVLQKHSLDRTLRWQQRMEMIQAEDRVLAAEGSAEREATVAFMKRLKRQAWYQTLLLAMRCVHDAKGRDSRGRSLDRAVWLFDSYALTTEAVPLDRAVTVTATTMSCSASMDAEVVNGAHGQAACGGGMGPSTSVSTKDMGSLDVRPGIVVSADCDCERQLVLAELRVSEKEWRALLVLATACLQLASKHEDVNYLDVVEVQAKAVDALIDRRQDPSNNHSNSHNNSNSNRATQQQLALYLALAGLGSVEAHAVLEAEEAVLRALRFCLGPPTARDFTGLYSEECYALLLLALSETEGLVGSGASSAEDNIAPSLCADSQAFLCLVPCWDVTARRARRGTAEVAGSPPPWLPFLGALNDIVVTNALSSPDCCALAPSLLASSAVWLSMRILLALTAKYSSHSSAACAEQTQSVGAEVPADWAQQLPSDHIGAQMTAVLQAALETWSGYSAAELDRAAHVLWELLRAFVDSGEGNTLLVGLTVNAELGYHRLSLQELLLHLHLQWDPTLGGSDPFIAALHVPTRAAPALDS